MRGLIVCAGKGSRLHPFSVSDPKPLLPVANKPVLFYGIEKIAEMGIKQIGLVINPLHGEALIRQLGSGDGWGVELHFIHQNEPKGIANAVLQAKNYIGNESFTLLLGDNLFQPSLVTLRECVDRGESDAGLLLAVVENPKDYGIAEIVDHRVIRLEEKPKHPTSNYAVMGAYVFTSRIFEAIEHIAPSARGEYEITDAIQWLIEHGHRVTYTLVNQPVTDVGTLERWLEANRWMLDDLGGVIRHDRGTFENVRWIPPVAIASDCMLKDSTIGPYVSVGPGVTMIGCRVSNAVVLEGAHIEHVSPGLYGGVIGKHSVMIFDKKVGDR